MSQKSSLSVETFIDQTELGVPLIEQTIENYEGDTFILRVETPGQFYLSEMRATYERGESLLTFQRKPTSERGEPSTPNTSVSG